MQDLNVIYLPLYGFSLIEASAGTGKTYSLIIIYIRLLLNLRNSPYYSNPLTTKEILVVSFTKTAAKELRIRIKQNIKQFRLDCIQRHSENYIFSKLLLQIRDINLAIYLLSIAEKEIDQASIFTIHSFCQKILTENKIELNMLFHTSIIEHEVTLYKQICYDFWRRHFYSLPLNIITLINQYWKNPEELLNNILPYIHNNPPKSYNNKIIYESSNHIPTYYAEIINCINQIKYQWLKEQHNIFDNLLNYNLNCKIYNKHNLTRWIKILNQWSKKLTLDHILPDCLERFRSSVLHTNNNLKSLHISFLHITIEKLYQKLSCFPVLIFKMAILEIRQNLDNTKCSRSDITFNDLITLLLNYISKNKNNKLLKKILHNYPVAIIDEFQDTDFNQYKIFQKLYSNQSKNNSLILIGDPKQSIYSFRGADIFTYLKIRKLLFNKYRLNINWRSSPGMVNAINQLFKLSNPFIFEDIPFIPAISAYQNNQHKLVIQYQPQESICFWLHPDNFVTLYNYKTAMTKECINTIQYLLSNIQKKTVWLENKKCKKKILQQSDIVILVRNHEEASLIRSELLKINVPSIFLSNRKNIFETIECYELYLLLQAILFPTRNTICTALATVFFSITAEHIEKINNKIESQWVKILNEFSEYYLIWEKNSIFSMIQKIIFRYDIPKKLLSMNSGKSILINILHLGEILNNILKQIRSKHALVQWLKLKITQSVNNNQHELTSDYILRYDDNFDLIKISTIHQSKGLEFPITLLPFAANFEYNKKILFHDRKSFDLYIDFDKSKLHSKLSDEERLADDIRLLYVAITRSIYHCSIGIAPITYKHKKKHNFTDLHHSAIGYLIQNKKQGTAESLKKNLQDLNIHSNGDINFRYLSRKENHWILTQHSSNQSLSYEKWIPKIIKNCNNSWHITSYSELKNTHEIEKQINLQNLLDCDINDDFYEKESKLTKHTFPKGKICGEFFHNLFKTLDFKKLINIQWLQNQMILYNIDLKWITVIRQWIYSIINTPLDKYNLTLSKITFEHKQTEFQFCLNINTNLTAIRLNNLCKQYDYVSRVSPVIAFKTITGMLRGFIDLVFYWNKKYYLLDYKTNWLGNEDNSYVQSNIILEMIKYRYDLQYQIYTLALHRFLKHKILSYNYEKDFGGIYYLFIRGMNGLSSNHGIYFYKPEWEFIRNLDYLF